ncbi:uncharacterized protein Tco025E_06159 [Trypanosoma conorhini]|uniref:Uncharacterized protein n=1 Tax=Trypanosoma conorhini TaxID=83891 RepID=A0A3R7N0A3_9TRYP|nr:uncharacterized protein Tco025E_06159 [Trypanosoma conorhini]RNF13909.1 hypothetical protein Tco025E_06159 [Trypanosoma conorhini]
MLHFHAVQASVWGGGDEVTCATLPPAWRHASRAPSSCGPPQFASAASAASSMHAEQGREDVPGVYARLVGVEFIGSCYASGSLQETVLAFRSSERTGALDAAAASPAPGDSGACGDGAAVSVVYFMALLVASCNGTDTSIEAVRCAFCGAADDGAEPHGKREPAGDAAGTAPPSPRTLQEAFMDREPDLLLRRLWDLLQRGARSQEPKMEGAPPSPTAASASSFQLIDRTPLLLRAGVMDVVQASLAMPPSCLPALAPAGQGTHSRAAAGAGGGPREGVATHGLMLSFTERLDARTAAAAMPEGRQRHPRRSFASLRRFLQRRTDAAAAPAGEAAWDVAPHRYFVWLHVVGTDLFYEATVTEKVGVPLPTRLASSTTPCSVLHEHASRKTEETDPLGQWVASTPTPRQASVQSETPPGVAARLAVAALPANAFCQVGYFLQRNASDAALECGGRTITATFHWISACDYAKQGLQVKEVSYVQEGDAAASGAGVFGFIRRKGGSRRQRQRARRCEDGQPASSPPAVVARRRTLEVRATAQWSLAQYPQWHHWDPVTQRLSFWAAFRTYDKLRIVAFHGHPDKRCCEFERNLPRRRHNFASAAASSPTSAGPAHHDGGGAEATSTPPRPLAVARGFGVSGACNDAPRGEALGSGAALPEPWGTACCSALARLHMTIVPVQYEDGARELMLCEQLFLSCEESRTGTFLAAARAATQELGPPAILCTITALRNCVDAVRVTVPLTPDERRRTTYDTRVTFFSIAGMIAIYLPGVCVHYVDVHHSDAPPRYLFGVRLRPPAGAPAATPSPLVSYLPVPFGRWLYVPGTVMLFEAALHPSSVWRFIRRYLICRWLCRVRASGIPAVGGACISPRGGERQELPSEYFDGDAPQDFVWRRRPQEAPAAAAFLQPAPLHFAVHVALTHLQPPRAAGEDELGVDPPPRRRDPAPLPGAGPHPPASASCLGWEGAWAARDAQLESVFAAHLSADTWRDVSVEFLSALVLSEAYARTRLVCCWRPARSRREGAAEANGGKRDAPASAAEALGLRSPHFVRLPLWDPAGLAAAEAQCRREVAAYSRAWRHQQQQGQGQDEEEEMTRTVPLGGGLPHEGVSPAATAFPPRERSPLATSPPPRQKAATAAEEGTTGAASAARRRASSEAPMTCPRRDVSCSLQAPVESGSGFLPDAAPTTTAWSGGRGAAQSRLRMEGAKETAVPPALLVRAVSYCGAAVARQQCHNTVPEWWLAHGVCVQPAPPRSPRTAPHLRLLFTSRSTPDDDNNGARGTSLLRRIRDAFTHSHGSHPPSTPVASLRSASSFSACSGASMSSVGRVALPAFPAAASAGGDSCAAGTSEGLTSSGGSSSSSSGSSASIRGSGNSTGSTKFVLSSAFCAPADSRAPSGSGEGGGFPATKFAPPPPTTLPHTQSAASIGSLPPHTGGAPASTAAHPTSALDAPSPDRMRHAPFEGPSCGAPFAAAVLEQLQLLLKTSPAGHAPRPSEQASQHSPQRGDRRAPEAPWSSRFLTPSAASFFASLLADGATLSTAAAAHLELLALLYDAAVASVVHALVRIAILSHPTPSSSPATSAAAAAAAVNSAASCSQGHEPAASRRGREDGAGGVLARWSFGQRLALALERLGVPPSLQLVESLAREGLRRFPARAVIAGLRCGALEGVTLALLLRHQPALAALLREHVGACAPQLSRELGLLPAPAPAACALHGLLTPAEEQALAETTRRALCGDPATPAPSRSGYRDATAPAALALQPAFLPRSQARMLLSRLLTHAAAAPQEVTLPREGSEGVFTQTAPPREQKRQLMTVLDPAPYLQRGGERSIPPETEFASPFPPFQWWWQQRAARRTRVHSFTCRGTNAADGRSSKPLFTTPTKVGAVAAAPCTPLPSPAAPLRAGLPFDDKHEPDTSRGTGSLLSLCEPALAWSADGDGGVCHPIEEAQEAATAAVTALLPQLLAATPLGPTVAKERAKAAMSIALDPFFKRD